MSSWEQEEFDRRVPVEAQGPAGGGVDYVAGQVGGDLPGVDDPPPRIEQAALQGGGHRLSQPAAAKAAGRAAADHPQPQ